MKPQKSGVKKSMPNLLIGPFSQILTFDKLPESGHLRDEELPVVEQGGILLEQGKIKAVAPFGELRALADQIEEIEGPAVALPGLIDAHTHIAFAGNRSKDYAERVQGSSYHEIAKKGGGILSTVNATRAASAESLSQALIERTGRMLGEGVTTCEVKSGYGLSEESELKILRAIQAASRTDPVTLIPTCLAAHVAPPEFKNPSEYLDCVLTALLPKIRQEQLAGRVDIFVEKGAFSVEEARPFLLSAQQMGFDILLHGDQFTRGGALLAGELSALSVDHLEVSQEEDFNYLHKRGVIPIMLPAATLGLGIPFPPARKALDAGLPLVIASDWNPGSAPMGYLLSSAAFLGAAEKLTLAETLAALTVRAARALKLHDRGELAPLKRGDIISFPCGDYREILYWQGGLKPNNVWIEGVRRK